MNLSKENLSKISSTGTEIPAGEIFSLPEKILQFGTGVLLRALPDYFVDKANRQGIFNGRILVVKSTQSGDTDAFDRQDGLYTISVRGMEHGVIQDHSVIISAISRVLSARYQWPELLKAAASEHLQIIISNTTEVGIQLVKESVFQTPLPLFRQNCWLSYLKGLKYLKGPRVGYGHYSNGVIDR
jgi:tagaturonate reductase